MNKIIIPSQEVTKLFLLVNFPGDCWYTADGVTFDDYSIEIETVKELTLADSEYKIYIASFMTIDETKLIDMCFSSTFDDLVIDFYFDKIEITEKCKNTLLKHFHDIIKYYQGLENG